MNAHTLVKPWYKKTFPTDEAADEINKRVSFRDVFEALDRQKNVYDVIGIGDSIIRERIFQQLSKIMNVDYDYIYKQWLSADSSVYSQSINNHTLKIIKL